MLARVRDLGTGGRLVAFALLLALVGGGAAAIGAASGTGADVSKSEHDEMREETYAEHAQANGLASSAGGFTFAPGRTSFGTGTSAFRFRILDEHDAPAHGFDLEGGVRLHLIVVRRDFTGYTHLHPRLQPDGSWLVPLRFGAPGVYRAFADFEHGGRKTVLGRDLFVSGELRPRPLPPATRTARVGAFTVALAPQELHLARPTDLRFRVSRHGRRVESFQSYVGARGHLVALHEGDVAYSHVHPLDGRARGRIDFRAELHDPGRYRLFLQFRVGGRVHTAPFTVEVRR